MTPEKIDKELKILIVEDEVLIAADLESRVKALGYTVCGKATTAKKALDLLKAHQPDLVMMDIVLKGEMDGIEAAEVIRDKWGVPVVFLTAYADADRLERAKFTYPFGYMQKPFQDRDLKITIEMALYASQVEAERRLVMEDLRLHQTELEAQNQELRQTQIELKEAHDKFFNLYELMPVGYLSLNEHGLISQLNLKAASLLGLEREKIINLSCSHFIAKKWQDTYHAHLRKAKQTGANQICELKLVKKDGKSLFARFEITPEIDERDAVKGYLVVIIDITDRKQAEEALRESEVHTLEYQDLLQELIDGLPFWVSIKDAKGRYLAINKNFAEAHKIKFQDIIGNTIHVAPELIPNGNKQMMERDRQVIDSGQKLEIPAYPVVIDGENRWRRLIKIPWFNQQREVIGVISISEDITERKLSDEALKQSEEQVRLLLNSTAEAIYGIDLEGNCNIANPSCARLLGYESVNELIGNNLHVLMHHTRLDGSPYPMNECRIHQAIRQGKSAHVDDEIFWRRDGTCFPAEYWSYPIIRENEVVGSVVTFLDITTRRQAEDNIAKSLKEKEILIQEINHRVKNNMQVIISLLKLQADRITDEILLDILLESQGRVYAMAAVHETLHQSDSMTSIDLYKYISTLINGIMQSYDKLNQRVNPILDLNNLSISLNQATPLGLVIHELISNSLKYAFKDRFEGEISVKGRYLESEIELEISDNGSGFPADLDWYNSPSLGLQIVRSLVEDQLEGTIDLANRQGVCVTIRFKPEGV